MNIKQPLTAVILTLAATSSFAQAVKSQATPISAAPISPTSAVNSSQVGIQPISPGQVKKPPIGNGLPNPNPEPIPIPSPMSVDDYYEGRLTPKEISDIKKREIDREQASSRVSISGNVVAKTVSLNLQGSNKPHHIRIAQGYGTSIVFVDSTGSPWPIRRIDNFNASSLGLLGFEGQTNTNKDCRTDTVNSFSVFAKSRFDSGVINVFLCDTPVPVVFDFNSDVKAKDVDNPVEVRIGSRGPLAKTDSFVSDGRPTYSGVLLSLLDGQPPVGSIPLASGHPSVFAWSVGNNSNGTGKILLKTSMTIFSPAPIESRSGANGVSTYLMPATPVILVSDSSGRVVSIVLSEKQN